MPAHVLAQLGLTDGTTVPLSWLVAILVAAGGLFLGIGRWWIGGVTTQNAQLSADLKATMALLGEVRADQRVQAERLSTLTAEVGRLRDRLEEERAA